MSTILVIDDDRNLCCAVRAALSSAGHVVLDASTAAVGVQVACQRWPDLVPCDLHLGEGSGFAVLAQLRQDGRTATVPFILMTASEDDSVMRQGMDLGADDYLRKPFAGEQLLSAVAARLRKQEAVRRHAQQALQESEVRFRAIASTVPIALIMLDPDARVILWNPAAACIFGHAETEAVGRSIFDLIVPPDLVPAYKEALDWSHTQGSKPDRLLNIRASRRGQDGFIAEMSACGIIIDSRFHTVLMARDITQQEETTQALRRERILLRTIIDALPACVYAKDRATRKTLANLADVRACGARNEAEVLGRTDTELLDPSSAIACFEDDRRVLQQGEPVVSRQELIVNALAWIPMAEDRITKG